MDKFLKDGNYQADGNQDKTILTRRELLIENNKGGGRAKRLREVEKNDGVLNLDS